MYLFVFLSTLAFANSIIVFGMGSEREEDIQNMRQVWSDTLQSQSIEVKNTRWIVPLSGPKACQLFQEIESHPESTYYLFLMACGVLRVSPQTLHSQHSFLTLPEKHDLTCVLNQIPQNVRLLSLIGQHAGAVLESLNLDRKHQTLYLTALDEESFSRTSLSEVLKLALLSSSVPQSIPFKQKATCYLGYVPVAMDLRLECLGKVIYWIQTVGPASIRFHHHFPDFPPIVQNSTISTPIYIAIDPGKHPVKAVYLQRILPHGSTRSIYRIDREEHGRSLVWPLELR